MAAEGLNVAKEALSILFYSCLWILLQAAYVVVTITQFAAIPIRALWRFFWTVLRFVIAPVTYTVSFIFSPLIIIVTNIPRFAPVYTFFGTAIFIGILCGLFLALTTRTTFSLFNLWDDNNAVDKHQGNTPAAPPPVSPRPDDDDKAHRHQQQLSGGSSSATARYSDYDDDDDRRELDALLAGISSGAESTDPLIAALQGSGWRDSANTKRKRQSVGSGGAFRLGSGRRFGPILEEDDDDSL